MVNVLLNGHVFRSEAFVHFALDLLLNGYGYMTRTDYSHFSNELTLYPAMRIESCDFCPFSTLD